jgi:N-acetyl-alpha-D-muramate 1-phosphate uridylyltransferase
MKAMILAAGRGKRMGDLTKNCPKPLLAYGDHCLIEHQILALKKAGFNELVINVCYLAGMIIDYLGDGARYGVSIHYSYEPESQGLETGGGVVQALPLLGDQPFVLTSADIVTDFDYALLRSRVHMPLHLVLVDNPDHHKGGDFGFNKQRGCLDATAPALNYAGICVAHPQIFQGLKRHSFPLRDVFFPLISDGRVSAEYMHAAWENIGTADQLRVL